MLFSALYLSIKTIYYALDQDFCKMKISKLYGPILFEDNWVPAPSFCLRRERILKLMSVFPRGKVIEFGCGAGTLLYELENLGFQCIGCEFSEKASSIAAKINGRNKIFVKERKTWINQFDFILAFEVLEHIEDDMEVLKRWTNYLRPEGRIIISVPAHPRKWNQSDLWAGHFRRYSKSDIYELLDSANLKMLQLENYGFPLQNMIRPIRNYFHKRQLRNEKNKDFEITNQSKGSGIKRSFEIKFFKYQNSILGQVFFKLCICIQNVCIKTNFGNGYIVYGRKR